VAEKVVKSSVSQWRYGPAAALACCIWMGAGTILGAFSPLLYPRYQSLNDEAMFLGALGGLLGGIAWSIHMVRRSLRRRAGGSTVAAGAWLGLGVLSFYGLLLQAGVAILLESDPYVALPRAAVAVGAFAAPVGFLMGLILGWMWAAVDATRQDEPARRTASDSSTAQTSDREQAALLAAEERLERYRSLLRPPEPSAFDLHGELDFHEDDEAGEGDQEPPDDGQS